MKMRKRAGAALLAAVLQASAATAAPVGLSTDGAWFEFMVGDVGDVWRSPMNGDPISFTVNSPTAFTLRLADLGFAGDRVEVLQGGTSLVGASSAAPVDDTVYAFTPDEAFAAPATWSQGAWLLSAGSYSFSGRAMDSPFGGGSWAISAVAQSTPSVSEPGALSLVLISLCGAVFVGRRCRA